MAFYGIVVHDTGAGCFEVLPAMDGWRNLQGIGLCRRSFSRTDDQHASGFRFWLVRGLAAEPGLAVGLYRYLRGPVNAEEQSMEEDTIGIDKGLGAVEGKGSAASLDTYIDIEITGPAAIETSDGD